MTDDWLRDLNNHQSSDLPSAVKNAEIAIYTDDSSVYYAAITCHELNQVLSSELNIVLYMIG